MRIEPVGPAQAYTTYALARPIATHRRPASCAEVDCANHRDGFGVPVDEGSELGRTQAQYIRSGVHGRAYAEERGDMGVTLFTFKPGSQCFRAHSLPIAREPLYLVRPGDHRGDPSGQPPRRHARAVDWIEDFAGTLDRVRDARDKG